MIETIERVRAYREMLLADRTRPGYHFAIPDDDGEPGDPNGAFYADGRYHLMYLYRRRSTGAFHWGHISSHDLLHWRAHPDAIGAFRGDEGCFSGGAFVDDDGTAYLTFWKFPSRDGTDRGGIALACARPPYDEWTRIEPLAVECGDEQWGVTRIDGRLVGCADPSNIWKKDGVYYLQAGRMPEIHTRWGKDDPAYRGDWTELFTSTDLKTWRYEGRFYQRRTDNTWTDETEDDMCPSFLPLPLSRAGGAQSGKQLQLFIAHNKGAQYYIGEQRGDRFFPERHGRMSWVDNTFFAPEALVDGRGRQIMWAWLLDNPRDSFARFGWSGVFSLPRELWLRPDGELGIAPAAELDRLCCNERRTAGGRVCGTRPVAAANGASARIRVVVTAGDKAGIAVCATEDLSESVKILFDRSCGRLLFDTTRCAAEGRPAVEYAPLSLDPGEDLTLDVFVDRSVVEVFANGRQAVCRRAFGSRGGTGVFLLAPDGADFGETVSWEVAPTNFY